MQVKSILNRVQLHRDFVYGTIRWREKPGRLALEVEIRPRKGSRAGLFPLRSDLSGLR